MTQKEPLYIISEKMLRIWRESCVNLDNPHTSDTFCKKNCGYRGKGGREGCCDFDDNAMEKIFRSHPYNPEQEKQAAINGVLDRFEGFAHELKDLESIVIRGALLDLVAELRQQSGTAHNDMLKTLMRDRP